MTKRTSSLVALATLAGAAALSVSVAPGCSSKSSSTATTPASTPGVQPPTRPTGAAPTGGVEKWFAVNGLKLGLTPKNSTTHDTNAWKSYGFDIDQRQTTADQSKAAVSPDNGAASDSCWRVQGSPSGMLTDGNNGIDNNFGGHIMQVISQLQSGAEDSVNTSIADGSFTLILHLTNYTTADNSAVPGELFVGNDFGDPTGATKSPPTFTTADKWPIVPSSLKSGATTIPGNAMLQFAGGYVSNGYWVSGDFGGTGTLNLNISISGADISLPIDSGIVTFKLADGTDGTIAGAMGVQKLQDSLGPVAKKFGICPSSSTYQQVVTTLTQSADLTGGDQADHFNKPGQTCDAISIALGFTVKETGAPTTIHAPPGAPGPDQCDSTDAGTDAASGG